MIDVLLNDQEASDIRFKKLYKGVTITYSAAIEEAVLRAQCRKLLGALTDICVEHDHKDVYRRVDCAKCMAEIEEALNG